MRLKSIFGKFMIPMILILCIFAITILGVTGNLLDNTYNQQIIKQNDETNSFISQSVANFMNKAYAITEELAYSDSILSMDGRVQLPVVQGTADRNDYFELIYIQDTNGDQTARSTGEPGNRSDRWWFKQMMEFKKPFISKSYYSINTNMACASIFYPLTSGGRMTGILATDIKLATLQSLVEKYSDIADGRLSFIIDGEGTVLAHPESVYYEELYNYKNLTKTISKKDNNGNIIYDDAGNIATEEKPVNAGKDFSNMITSVMSGKSGSAEVTDNGVTYYASYTPVQLDGYSDTWSVITLYNKKYALSLIDKVSKSGIFVTVIAVILAIFLIALVTKTITKPIKLCLERIKLLARGDLTTVVPEPEGHDEVSGLLINLNKTIATLNDIMQEISNFAESIAGGNFNTTIQNSFKGEFNHLASSLASISQSMGNTIKKIDSTALALISGADDIDMSAQSLANGTASQASAAEELFASLTDITEKINNNSGNTRKANEMMVSVQDILTKGRNALQNLIKAMDAIENNSNEIKNITGLMQNIASQTNLLSINASVEAARAGETGKGFTVVASEIRALAGKCNDAAADTAELIEKTCKNVKDGMESLQYTVSALKNVTVSSQDTANLIRNIAISTSEQSEAIEQIHSALGQISDVTQDNSANAQKNAGTCQEMLLHARQLKMLLDKYKY